MPTSKKRLNITLPKDIAIFLEKISIRDEVPQATKVVELIEKALELEEDEYFSRIADQRATDNDADYISAEEFWKQAL
jgi:predicted DNA-binding protein